MDFVFFTSADAFGPAPLPVWGLFAFCVVLLHYFRRQIHALLGVQQAGFGCFQDKIEFHFPGQVRDDATYFSQRFGGVLVVLLVDLLLGVLDHLLVGLGLFLEGLLLGFFLVVRHHQLILLKRLLHGLELFLFLGQGAFLFLDYFLELGLGLFADLAFQKQLAHIHVTDGRLVGSDSGVAQQHNQRQKQNKCRPTSFVWP